VGGHLRSALRWTAGPVVAVAIVAACNHGSDAGEGCMDFELGPNDLACGSDSDCTIVVTGKLCEDDPCNGPPDCIGTPTPANTVASARFNRAIVGYPNAECGTYTVCTMTLVPLCVGSVCTACGVSGEPAGCSPDAGYDDDGGS